MQQDSLNIKKFFLSRIDKLYSNIYIRNKICGYGKFFRIHSNYKNKKILFLRVFKIYLEEACLTLEMIGANGLSKRISLLEIGGGIGIIYAFLKSKGYNIHSLEPSTSGYEGHYQVGLHILQLLKIDSSRWYPLSADQSLQLGQKYDLIFSNNVLEHVKDINKSLLKLKKVLKLNGIMIHNTVNYIIPYEPHLGIILFPFFPKFTVLFNRSLEKSKLWKGLNFINTKNITKICTSCGFTILFEKDIIMKTFNRLVTDNEFRQRQKIPFIIYQLLKSSGMMKLVNSLPVHLTTPVRFILKKI